MPWYDKKEAFRVGVLGIVLIVLGAIVIAYPPLAQLQIVPGLDIFWERFGCELGCVYVHTGWTVLMFWLGVVVIVIGVFCCFAWEDYFHHKRLGR